MKKVSVFLLAIFLTVSAIAFGSEKGSASGQVGEIADSVKSAAQKAMLNFIQNETCTNGTNCALGSIKAEFDYIHQGLKEKDGHYVSCADFKAGSDVYDVDYYVELKDGEYGVEKVLLHKKNGEPVNDILWSKHEAKGSGTEEKDSDHEHKGSATEKKGSGYEKKGSAY